MTAEIVGRFENKQDETPLDASTIGSDICNVTAIGNDYGKDSILKRPLEAKAQKGDLLVLFTNENNNELIK